MKSLRVYFGFRSPYSRLGLHVIDRAGLDPELIPFFGPPGDVEFVDPTQNKLKLAYYREDVPRMTIRMGLPIGIPNPFEVDFTQANNAAVAAARDGKGLAFAIAVSDARWGRGEDVSDRAVLEACADAAGWSREAVGSAQEDPDIAARIADQHKLIEEDGVFGVPFAVLKSDAGVAKFWGHDRFDLLVEAAKA